MDAKTSFLDDKELSDWLRSIVNDFRFKKCIAFADSELLATDNMSGEMLVGVKKFKAILMDLAEIPNPPLTDYPKTGLHHDLDIKPRTKKPAKPAEKPK